MDFQRILFIWISKILLVVQLFSMGLSSMAFAQESHEDWVIRGNCFATEEASTIRYFLTETNRSFQSFGAISPQCRNYILASLLKQDFYKQDRKGAVPEDMVPDRDLILQNYMTANNWKEVYTEALVLLVASTPQSDFNASLTSELFQTLLKSEPSKAVKYLCRVMWDLGTPEGEIGVGEIEPGLLGSHLDAVDRLRPLVSMRPELAAQTCNFPNNKVGQIRQYSIRYLMELAASEAAKSGGVPTSQKTAVSGEVVRMYSSCNERQLVSIFHTATQVFYPQRSQPQKKFRLSEIPSQNWIMETQDTCLVQGVLKVVRGKSPSEADVFLFYPSSQTRFQEPKTKPIPFTNVFEIAQLLKQSYVLTKTQAAPQPIAPTPKQNPSQGQSESSDGGSVLSAFEALRQFFGSGRSK